MGNAEMSFIGPVGEVNGWMTTRFVAVVQVVSTAVVEPEELGEAH